MICVWKENRERSPSIIENQCRQHVFSVGIISLGSHSEPYKCYTISSPWQIQYILTPITLHLKLWKGLSNTSRNDFLQISWSVLLGGLVRYDSSLLTSSNETISEKGVESIIINLIPFMLKIKFSAKEVGKQLRFYRHSLGIISCGERVPLQGVGAFLLEGMDCEPGSQFPTRVSNGSKSHENCWQTEHCGIALGIIQFLVR